MNPKRKIVLAILILMNTIVLLGQIWPEGAPPFAKTINLTFLISSFLFLIHTLVRYKPADR